MVEVRQTLMTIVEVPLVQNVEIVRHVPKPDSEVSQAGRQASGQVRERTW